MQLTCAHCAAAVNAARMERCPACGESLTDAKDAPALSCSHCGAIVDPAAFDCAVCGAPLDLAAIAQRAAEEAQAFAAKMEADANALNDIVSGSMDEAAEAQATALRMAAEAEVAARAAAAAAPHSRLSCRHCGAFVDPTASPQCPVCLESTSDAIPVPWTPPAEPDEDAEAAPMQVSAIKVPEAVSSAGMPAPKSAIVSVIAEEPERPRAKAKQRESPLRSEKRPALTAEAIVPAVDAPPRDIAPVRASASAANVKAPATPAELPAAFPLGLVIAFALVAAISFLAGAATMLILRH